MNPGLIGGIAGCVIGTIGGLDRDVRKHTEHVQPPVKSLPDQSIHIIGWIVGLTFLALLLLLPSPWRFFLWLPYGILLYLLVSLLWNRTQQRIRAEESQNQQVHNVK